MSWTFINLAYKTGHQWQGAYCDPATNKCYNLRGVEAGGRYTLNVIDLATLSITTHDLGLGVETTDVHFNPSMCGLTSDRSKLICCRARWTALRCMEIDLGARTARWIGTVAPAGDTSLNYPKWFRVRPDKWLAMARTGDGAQWSFFEFRGEPEQILDSALWSRRAILPNNSGTGGSCADGSIYFMYQAILFQDPVEPWKIWMGYHNRCIPPPNRFTFGLMYYDMVRDRFYGWKGDLLDEARTYRTFDPELKVEYQPPPGVTDAVRAELDIHAQGVRVRTTAYDYILAGIKVMTAVGAGWDRAGVVKIDLRNRTATATYLGKVIPDVDTSSVQPFIATADGKAVGVQGEEAGTIVLYDPATDSLTEIAGGRGVGWGGRLWVLGDKTLIPATHMFMSRSVIAVWSRWSTDMKMLTKCLATGGAGSVRVEADFWATRPSQLEVTIYKLPDLTIETTDTVTSPSKPFSKTYSITAGNKRVLCRAIP